MGSAEKGRGVWNKRVSMMVVRFGGSGSRERGRTSKIQSEHFCCFLIQT